MFAHQHRAHRHGGVGEALGERHDIGHDAETLGGEAVAEAAESGDDLVENQQDTVRTGDLAETLEIALGRQNAAGGAGLDRQIYKGVVHQPTSGDSKRDVAHAACDMNVRAIFLADLAHGIEVVESNLAVDGDREYQ